MAKLISLVLISAILLFAAGGAYAASTNCGFWAKLLGQCSAQQPTDAQKGMGCGFWDRMSGNCGLAPGVTAKVCPGGQVQDTKSGQCIPRFKAWVKRFYDPLDPPTGYGAQATTHARECSFYFKGNGQPGGVDSVYNKDGDRLFQSTNCEVGGSCGGYDTSDITNCDQLRESLTNGDTLYSIWYNGCNSCIGGSAKCTDRTGCPAIPGFPLSTSTAVAGANSNADKCGSDTQAIIDTVINGIKEGGTGVTCSSRDSDTNQCLQWVVATSKGTGVMNTLWTCPYQYVWTSSTGAVSTVNMCTRHCGYGEYPGSCYSLTTGSTTCTPSGTIFDGGNYA